ncbi:hypothetical protein BH24CHL4_BH24CHL4_18300 [soil metagenome]
MLDEYYELIDLLSGNLAGDFDREEDALRFLASVLANQGEDSVASYGLSIAPDPSNSHPALYGQALVHRVREFSLSRLASSYRRTA